MRAACVLATCVLQVWWCTVQAAPAGAQPLTREQQAAFLRTAEVINATQTAKGVTQPWRLTLSDGTLTHDAHFQSIDERKTISRTGRGRRVEFNFTDSWRFNVAAHRLAVLLGIGDMIPVSVERNWNGRRGAMTWWVDDVLMDEEARRKQGAEAPDRDDWSRQDARMRVFTQLAYDTDRNQGNNLITRDWRLVMVDFTRAFRVFNTTPDPLTILRRADRAGPPADGRPARYPAASHAVPPEPGAMRRLRRTKIVATLGPRTASDEGIAGLLDAGELRTGDVVWVSAAAGDTGSCAPPATSATVAATATPRRSLLLETVLEMLINPFGDLSGGTVRSARSGALVSAPAVFPRGRSRSPAPELHWRRNSRVSGESFGFVSAR